jgi:hypothetical protein
VTLGRSSLVVVVVAVLVQVVLTCMTPSCSVSFSITHSLTHSPNWQSYLVAFLYWLDVWSLSSVR